MSTTKSRWERVVDKRVETVKEITTVTGPRATVVEEVVAERQRTVEVWESCHSTLVMRYKGKRLDVAFSTWICEHEDDFGLSVKEAVAHLNRYDVQPGDPLTIEVVVQKTRKEMLLVGSREPVLHWDDGRLFEQIGFSVTEEPVVVWTSAGYFASEVNDA